MSTAQAAGYELEYAVNSDLEPERGGPALLEHYSGVLSVGHDECELNASCFATALTHPWQGGGGDY